MRHTDRANEGQALRSQDCPGCGTGEAFGHGFLLTLTVVTGLTDPKKPPQLLLACEGAPRVLVTPALEGAPEGEELKEQVGKELPTAFQALPSVLKKLNRGASHRIKKDNER